jgi:DNA-binding response OmpR family regulator
MNERILVVDDEEEYRALFTRYLTSEGFLVVAVQDGTALRRELASTKFDIILLDLGLPEEDGLTLLQHIRKLSPTPVIIVSGKSDPVDRVVGLEVGADDYITKPFLNRELLARVRAVLRRSQTASSAPASSAAEVLDAGERYVFGSWCLDVIARRLSDGSGDAVKLTSAEFDLLVALARNAGRPITRDHLLDLVHGRDWSPIDRSIDVHIANLRKKIESDPRNPEYIATVRNIGYAFSAAVRRQ